MPCISFSLSGNSQQSQISYVQGKISSGVDPGIITFANHGCDGKFNVGANLNETEATIELGQGPTKVYRRKSSNVFDPFLERHFSPSHCADFVTHRDIEVGEELFDNYIVFGGSDEEDFETNLVELKALCSGGVGTIFEYEEDRN